MFDHLCLPLVFVCGTHKHKGRFPRQKFVLGVACLVLESRLRIRDRAFPYESCVALLCVYIQVCIFMFVCHYQIKHDQSLQL